jgi:hypothetical protein
MSRDHKFMGSFKMKNLLIATGAAVMLAALATPAAAKVVVEPGVYVFTAADGSQQTYTVSIDSNNDTAITAFGVGFNEPCRGVPAGDPAYSLITGWGFGGDDVINPNNGKVTFSAKGNYFTFDVTLQFGAGGTATGGTIESYGVTLYPQPTEVAHPTKALFCVSALQAVAFTSFTPAADAPAISTPNTAKSVHTPE